MTVTWHGRGLLFCPDLLSVFREVLCRNLRAAPQPHTQIVPSSFLLSSFTISRSSSLGATNRASFAFVSKEALQALQYLFFFFFFFFFKREEVRFIYLFIHSFFTGEKKTAIRTESDAIVKNFKCDEVRDRQ